MTINIKAASLTRLLNTVRYFCLQKFNNRFFRNSKIANLVSPFPLSFLPVNPELGQAWLYGNYPLKGGVLRGQTKMPFECTPPNKEWLANLYAFDWLIHFCGLEHPQANKMLRYAALYWLNEKPFKQKLAWQPDIVARRFISLSACSAHIMAQLTPQQQTNFIYRLNVDARYLAKMIPLSTDNKARLIASCAYVFSTFAINNGTIQLNHAMSLLTKELKRQVLSDGAHISRAPDAMVSVLPVLLTIQEELKRRQLSIPGTLQDTIKKAAIALRFLQHGDGHLAIFQGGLELGCFSGVTKSYLATLIKMCGVRRNPKHVFLLASQYYRVEAGKTLVLFDAGTGHINDSHIAPTSFEVSRGTQRIFVNCGANYVNGNNWREASRQAAAHTVLGMLEGIRTPQKKIKVIAKKLEDPNATWLETSHDMYKNNYGIETHRRLFIHQSGADIRGEEMMLSASNKPILSQPFALRFHLHPNIKASRARNQNSILLALPNGEGWQFSAQRGQAKLSLVKSVYMGQNGMPRQCQQIVIEGQTDSKGLALKWGLKLMRQ